MYFPRTFASLSALLLLGVVLGCGGLSAVDVLQKAYDAMKGPSAEFEAALAGVVDGATAQDALPKLKAASEKMVGVSLALEKAMGTTSRNSIALKKEIEDYRRDQKKKVSEHVRRINEIPGAKKVLAEILEKIEPKKS